MDDDAAVKDSTLRDLGWVLLCALAILLVLVFAGAWSAREWWGSAMDLSANSPVRTVLILVLAPLVACGSLLLGLRGEDAWTSGRTWRTAVHFALAVLAFGGCIVLPGTTAGREIVTTWLA